MCFILPFLNQICTLVIMNRFKSFLLQLTLVCSQTYSFNVHLHGNPAAVHPVSYRAQKNLFSRWCIQLVFGLVQLHSELIFLVSQVVLYGQHHHTAVTLVIILPSHFSIFWTLKKPGPGGKNINPFF